MQCEQNKGVNLSRRSYPKHTWQHNMPKCAIEGGVFFLSQFVTRNKPAVLMMFFLSVSLQQFRCECFLLSNVLVKSSDLLLPVQNGLV